MPESLSHCLLVCLGCAAAGSAGWREGEGKFVLCCDLQMHFGFNSVSGLSAVIWWARLCVGVQALQGVGGDYTGGARTKYLGTKYLASRISSQDVTRLNS